MARLTARDFPPEVMSLFDHYVHGRLDRRGFLEGASRHAGGGMTALAMLAALSPDFAMAQRVLPDDARLDARFVEIDSRAGRGRARGYLVRPKGASAKLPAVLVVHENRGLNPLAAAVPFYGGSQPAAADAGKIKAAVMIHTALNLQRQSPTP